MMRASLLAAVLALAACSDESYVVVTVAARPAVHDAANLRVTLSNAGSARTEVLELGEAALPLTFSISAPDRSGELGISVDAINRDELIVGRGAVTTDIGAESTDVLLDTADFVVNSEVAGDQYPEDDYEAHGFQVSSAADGTWTSVYRGDCGEPCNMLARRFDANGRAVTTRAAASDLAFPVSSTLASSASVPAIATAGASTLAVWDIAGPTVNDPDGIACRAIDAQGMMTANQIAINVDPSTDVVSIAPLSNSNFVATWYSFDSTLLSRIRAQIIKPDCTPLGGAYTVSTLANPRRADVASNGNSIMYAWRVDGAVHVRLGALTGPTFTSADTVFLPATTTENVESVRVAPLGTGFAVVVRWSLIVGSTGPGRIEIYRTSDVGAVLGQPVVVTTRSGTDFASSEAFGVASRSDGTLLVTWHSCLENGDSQGCGVFARAFDAMGVPKGEELVVPTTTTGDQTNPSAAAVGADAFVVVWKDDSMTQPDTAGSAVRARIIYVP